MSFKLKESGIYAHNKRFKKLPTTSLAARLFHAVAELNACESREEEEEEKKELLPELLQHEKQFQQSFSSSSSDSCAFSSATARIRLVCKANQPLSRR